MVLEEWQRPPIHECRSVCPTPHTGDEGKRGAKIRLRTCDTVRGDRLPYNSNSKQQTGTSSEKDLVAGPVSAICWFERSLYEYLSVEFATHDVSHHPKLGVNGRMPVSS